MFTDWSILSVAYDSFIDLENGLVLSQYRKQRRLFINRIPTHFNRKEKKKMLPILHLNVSSAIFRHFDQGEEQ